jgi:hypothetical protein
VFLQGLPVYEIHPPVAPGRLKREAVNVVRRMSMGMQGFNIGRMLAGTRIDSEVFDIKAHLDSTLSYTENRRNIQKIAGITTRNRGMEQFSRQNAERARERTRRQNPLRQVGFSNEALDRLLYAQPPGRRISRTGRRYYEHRQNRSDVPPGRV